MAPHGNTIGQTGHLYTERLEHTGQIHGRGLSLRVGICRHNDLLNLPLRHPVQEGFDIQVVGPHAIHWGEHPMEHMVGPVVFPGPLHGNDILGIGHHTDHAAISFLTGADGAQPLSFREVLTDGAEGNGPLGLQNRLSKLLHLILGQRQDKKRQALGSLMANAGQAGKLLGHKAVVMAMLVVIAMASGLAMANHGGGAGGVSFERTDGPGSLVEPGSGDASSGKTSEGSSSKASAAAEVYVDVDGAVVSPGVYRLKDGARVAQAIDAAGGLAPEADVTGLNRASKVVDGQKIYVPTVGEQQASIAEAGVDGGASASSGVSGATSLVNINTASAEELQTLSGIGPSMAQSIIDERTKNGAFASVDDLMRVSGIGEQKLAKIKDCICV